MRECKLVKLEDEIHMCLHFDLAPKRRETASPRDVNALIDGDVSHCASNGRYANRLDWVDVAKGIGIFLVVAGHSSLPPHSRSLIYIFHMPLFFFVSGIFMRTGGLRLVHKIQSLVLPYIYFSVFEVVFFWMASFWLGREYSVVGAIRGFLIGNVPAMQVDPVLWFLPCLFVAQVIAQIFIHLRLPGLVAVAGLALTFLSYLLCNDWRDLFSERLPWGADAAVMASGFVVLGFSFRAWIDRFAKLQKAWLAVIFVGGLGVIVVAARKAGLVSIADYAYPHYFSFMSGALAGISATFALSRLIHGSVVLAFLGRNSMAIFAFHINAFFFLNLLLPLLQRLHLIPQDLVPSEVFGCSYTIAALMVLVPVVLLINRYVPWLVGKGKATSSIVPWQA